MRRILGALVVLGLAGPGTADPVANGSFTNGLVSWKAAWDASVSAEEAVLSDRTSDPVFLFQSVTLTDTVVTVSFDFHNGLSADVPAGRFRDSFYASVYGVDRQADFVLENDRFDRACALLDLDSNGAFNVRGAVRPSPRGVGWQHFSGAVTNSESFLYLVFELYDLNSVTNDSAVRIDNVTVEGLASP